MAQRHINYGAFPDDLNADAIRAAFQKTEDNFTELFTGAATAGVSRIVAGPGITLQGSSTGTGNVTVAASLNSVTLVTSHSADGSRNLLLGSQGGPQNSSSATTNNSMNPISVNVNQEDFRVDKITVANSILLGDDQLFSFASNGSIQFGGPNTPISGEFITGIISQPYSDENTGPVVAGDVQFSAILPNGQPIIIGSDAFKFDVTNNSNTAIIQNANVFGLANIATANISNAIVSSISDSNTGDTSQGALVVVGGFSVQSSVSIGNSLSNHTINGNITVPNGNIILNGNTPAGNLGQGTLIVTGNGGGSIGGNLFVGGSLQLDGPFTITNQTPTPMPNVGALVIRGIGGASIGGNIEIGGYANIAGNANIGTTANILGNANLGANLNVVGNANISSNIHVVGNITSTRLTANTEIIIGNANIIFTSNANTTTINSVDTLINSSGRTVIDSNTNIQRELTVDDTAVFNSNVTISNLLNSVLLVNTNVESNSTTTGALQIVGGAGITGNVYIGANANIARNLYVENGNLIVANTTSNISARGANTQIQYNNAGNLAGSANFTWNNTSGNLTVGGNLSVSTSANIGNRFSVSNTAVTIGAPTTLSNSVTINGVLTASNTVSFTGTTFTAPNANIEFRSLGVGTPASGVVGEIRATEDITAFFASDRQYKENIRPIDNALDKAAAISGYFFDWTDEHIANRGGEDGYFVNKHDIGVIAQEVQPHIPQAVKTRPNGSLAVDYPKLVALCLAALAEVKQELDKLKGK